MLSLLVTDVLTGLNCLPHLVIFCFLFHIVADQELDVFSQVIEKREFRQKLFTSVVFKLMQVGFNYAILFTMLELVFK
jgi:hypothetical protein